MKKLRAKIGKIVGLTPTEVEAHAPSSKWRFRLMQRLITLGEDTDTALGEWAEFGAPMGISKDIQSGGWFSKVVPTANMTIEELVALDYCKVNHTSFEELHSEEAHRQRSWSKNT